MKCVFVTVSGKTSGVKVYVLNYKAAISYSLLAANRAVGVQCVKTETICLFFLGLSIHIWSCDPFLSQCLLPQSLSLSPSLLTLLQVEVSEKQKRGKKKPLG